MKHHRTIWLWVIFTGTTLGISGCMNSSQPPHTVPAIPDTFDSLPVFPPDNQLTESRIALGRMLFFDKRLSSDGSTSCGSCHKPELAYADTVRVSAGVHGRLDLRNSPSLINVAWQKHLFREGGIPSLEVQALAPFSNENEMEFTLTAAAARIANDHAYRELSLLAYDTVVSAYVIARSLACFQRSLVSSGSPWDAYMTGDSTAMSPGALRGMSLFYSSHTQCASCHSGFLFTDQEYHNVGLYYQYSDEGRGRYTRKESDLGKMKTPSLRNVAITPPYMHDGSIATLDEVLQFFNEGGHPHPNKDSRVAPLGLDEDQLRDLKEFLYSLTDDTYTPPF